MSSFASVFVAKANATPENVVPCVCVNQPLRFTVCDDSYKINANYQLCLTSSSTLDLGRSHCIILAHGRLHALLWCAIPCTAVARRLRGTHCGICARIASRIDGRRMRRHWTLRSPCGGVIGVTWRPPQLVGIHTSARSRQTCLRGIGWRGRRGCAAVGRGGSLDVGAALSFRTKA